MSLLTELGKSMTIATTNMPRLTALRLCGLCDLAEVVEFRATRFQTGCFHRQVTDFHADAKLRLAHGFWIVWVNLLKTCAFRATRQWD